MDKLTVMQKKIILIGLGLLILICSFFLVFQRNQDQATELDTQSQKLKRQVEYLSDLQLQVNQMKQTSEQHKTDTENYVKEYPSTVTQQKAIFNVYQMMVDSGVRVTAIRPSESQKFIEKGQFVSTEQTENNGSGQKAVSPSAVEEAPEQQVDTLSQMVGKYSKYEVDMTGNMSQIMDMVDWVRDNKEHMSISNLSYTFDATSGKLTGTATINYYEINGNGNPYIEPKIDGIVIGTDSIFGALQK